MWEWVQSADIIDYIRASVEILLLAALFYGLFQAFHKTQGASILHGVVLLAVPTLLLISVFKLSVIGYIVTRILGPGLIAGLFIIFQPELRRSLEKLGRSQKLTSHFPILRSLLKLPSIAEIRGNFLDQFCASIIPLSNKQVGALIAIERESSLEPVTKSPGIILDAQFSPELISAIFHYKAALHDGGVVISQERIVAAACLFPVTSKELGDSTLGLRHRAGIGLSEEYDAVVVIVSEETGQISIACGGNLDRNISKEQLREKLQLLLEHPSSDERQER
jgi:diadenylate cyclase